MNRSLFLDVHRALQAQDSSKVIRMLTGGGNRICSPYSSDINHAWYLIGDANFREGRYLDAKVAFRRALSHWREDADAMMAIANCYTELGQPRYAIRYLEKALKFRPGDASLLFNLGNAFFDAGHFQQAVSTYKRARSKAGKNRLLLRVIDKNYVIARKHVVDDMNVEGAGRTVSGGTVPQEERFPE